MAEKHDGKIINLKFIAVPELLYPATQVRGQARRDMAGANRLAMGDIIAGGA